MSKNTLYFNTVGRSGKTSTAVIDAKQRGAKLYTNDWHNITDELYSDLFPKGDFVKIPEPKLRADGTFDYGLEIDSDDDIVFDFGGYVDQRVEFVAKYVDACVVPVHYLGKDEGIQTIRIVNSLLALNKNVSILISRTDTDLLTEARELFESTFPKLKVFTINKSKYITRLANFQVTPYDIAESGGVLERNYVKRVIIPQYEALFDYIYTK